MRKLLLFCMFLSVCLLYGEGNTLMAKNKKKVEKAVKESKKKLTDYEKLFKDKTVKTAKGDFVTLHQVEKKVYMEYPMKYMEREFLFSSTPVRTNDASIIVVGYKVQDPLLLMFVKQDSFMFLHQVNSAFANMLNEGVAPDALSTNYGNGVFRKYKVSAFSPDSSAVVMDVTDLFLEIPELPVMPSSMGGMTVRATNRKEFMQVKSVKAFTDNASVVTSFSSNVTLSFMMISLGEKTVDVDLNRSLLLLPENKMKPRVYDSRLGIFLTPKMYFSRNHDGVQNISFANRWRLEPKDMQAWERGELVEPIKPIRFYVDNSFPEAWKAPIKAGVLRWNQAFEKIGFKNVMEVMDFPTNDPNFDPDNLKYSCVRYSPTQTANAMGPSWVDPSTGEIINASVIIYNDIVQLINSWRFIQTAQVDPRVRNKKLSSEILDESLEYAVAHEVGHTLGLMHNMSASAAFPVDSLRSEKFTKKYGTTASIMDYARFNYVAQPGDKHVSLTPPYLGVYDYYAIKWLYSPVAGNKSVMEEAGVVEKWLDEKAGDPKYRYGQQQVASRYDPSAIEEDLGNDPLKAGEYGVNNLKYILKNLNEWIPGNESTLHKESLYNQLVNQYLRYVINCTYNIGGMYFTQVKEGTKGERDVVVPREIQKQSMQWVLKQIKGSQWLDNKEVTTPFKVSAKMSALAAEKLFDQLLARGACVAVMTHLDESAYSSKEYYDDLYQSAFESTISGRKLTGIEKLMQNRLTTLAINAGKAGTSDAKSKSVSVSMDEKYLYGIEENALFTKYFNELREIERTQKMQGDETIHFDTKPGDYGWKEAINLPNVDESNAYLVMMFGKIKNLVKNQLAKAPLQDKAHYQAMLLKLETLDKK